MFNKEKIEEQIRQIAYELYIKSGCIPNRDLDNWLEAERIVLERYNVKQELCNSEEESIEKPKKRTPKKKTSAKTTKSKRTSKTKKK